MTFNYANAVPKTTTNATEAILKAAADPKVISFAGGLPAPELFPVAAVKRATDRVFDQYGEQVLQYAGTLGYPKLREQIAHLMRGRKVKATVENIGIATGSQQAIDLVARMLINPGDVVLVEDPTYLAALDVFRADGAQVVGVAMDDDGMRMDDLQQKLTANPTAKFIYTIPNFQNPTGRTMTAARRQQMVKLADQFGVPIVEDDPYGAIRYAGTTVPPIKHYDRTGSVVSISSFSKMLAPGLRIGWITADPAFLQKYTLLKQNADLHTDNLTQYIIAQFLTDEDLQAHVQRITAVYEQRAKLMLAEIDRHFPADVYHSQPEGGMFIWVQVPGEIDSDELAQRCLEKNVAVVPGSAFYAGKAQPGTFRLNFSNMNDDQIKTGIKRIGEVLTDLGGQ
ncbi:PLP-dependent aminotransferase family protein [Fructilactobacillus myrtifloralis]|uniref:PLP-dependent aminotransferase family protein n=1 Tax=Fructilactobacillus myrtifloralis TaxID=2940301 RepID=A0ABY5BLT6_9LACO|nr:PLP-dependent aminotransferase family protein [Fructilactobacillus myrtifloralis]USS84484.1 PLP-dependent aminotransferase family protein [Fructilactobacillus myrtifloralis]